MKNTKTNAVRLLEQRKIAHQLTPYHYEEGDLSVERIAAENDLPVAQIFKTLVLSGDRSGVVVAVTPGDKQLDLKMVAQLSGNKKVALVPVADIQGLTGYIRGGCSPIGMKKNYPVLIDDSAFEHEEIYVNAGARGLLVRLAPGDLQKMTQATLGPLVL